MPPSSSSSIFSLLTVCLLIDVLLCQSDPILQLSVYPTFGVSTDAIEVRCQITRSTSDSPSASNYDHVYLSVKTDNVKPSGILLMADDQTNGCRINRERYIDVNICNRSHILIRINHTLLNDSQRSIDYACTKGDVSAFSSYRITRDQTAHHHDSKPRQLSSSSSLTASWPLLSLLTQTLVLLCRRGAVRCHT